MWTALLGTERVSLEPGEGMSRADMLDLRSSESARAALRCCGCKSPVHTRNIGGELDLLLVFVHNPGGGKLCRELGFHTDESDEHLMLKAGLARAVRRAGWTADLEVYAGRCRTDVLATSPQGRHWALEAQLATLSTSDAVERTKRYEAEFGRVTWSHTKARDWATRIPCLRVDDETQSVVIDGVMTDPTGQTRADPVAVYDVVPRILHNQITYVSGGDYGYFVDIAAQGQRPGQRQRKRRPGGRGAYVRECSRTAVDLVDAGTPAGQPMGDGQFACATCRKYPARWLATRQDWDREDWLVCDTCQAQAKRFRSPITFQALRTGG